MGLIVYYYLRIRTPNYRMPIVTFCVMLQAGFNNPWFVNLSTMEMTSQCSKLKWNQEPRFHCKVLNILTSFLLSTRVQTIENCCRFVSYNNIASFWRPFTLKFLGKSREREREKQTAPSWRYYHGLHSVRTKLSTNPRPRIPSVKKYLLTWCIKYF